MNTAVETRNTSVAGDVAARAGGSLEFLFIAALAEVLSSKGHANASTIRCYVIRVDLTRGVSRAAAIRGVLRRVANEDGGGAAARVRLDTLGHFESPRYLAGMVADAPRLATGVDLRLVERPLSGGPSANLNDRSWPIRAA